MKDETQQQQLPSASASVPHSSFNTYTTTASRSSHSTTGICTTTTATGTSPLWYHMDIGPKGRGLFASVNIPPRTLVHVAPCIVIPKMEYDTHMKYTVLEHYLFNDSRSGNKLLALGDGSLFNHSNRPNVDYRIDSKDEPSSSSSSCIRYYVGYQGIQEGQELCISYGANLWFDDVDGDSTLLCNSSTGSSDDEEGEGIANFLSRIELGSSST